MEGVAGGVQEGCLEGFCGLWLEAACCKTPLLLLLPFPEVEQKNSYGNKSQVVHGSCEL